MRASDGPAKAHFLFLPIHLHVPRQVCECRCALASTIMEAERGEKARQITARFLEATVDGGRLTETDGEAKKGCVILFGDEGHT